MTAERIREIGRQLRDFSGFAQNETLELSVRIENEDYYMDLGQFGECSTSVVVEDDYYQYDADDMLDKYPIGAATFEEFADELEEYEEPEATLDSVLARMEQNGEGALARAVRSSVEFFQSVMLKASDTNGLSVGPLPDKPLPWPGALRPEIDYTAADFPLRYQPPPGYDWATGSSGRLPYDKAESVRASNIAGGGTLVMDSLGRARWYNKYDTKDTYSEGNRWRIWYMDRDGIPAGNSFNGSDPPRAFDMYGQPIPEPGVDTDRFFVRTADREKVAARVREIRLAYEQPTALSLSNGTPGDTYDPLTVAVEAQATNVQSSELRLGDDIVGKSFGRVTGIENNEILMNRDGTVNRTPYRGTYVWSVKKIALPNRDSLPTAASLQPAAF